MWFPCYWRTNSLNFLLFPTFLPQSVPRPQEMATEWRGFFLYILRIAALCCIGSLHCYGNVRLSYGVLQPKTNKKKQPTSSSILSIEHEMACHTQKASWKHLLDFNCSQFYRWICPVPVKWALYKCYVPILLIKHSYCQYFTIKNNYYPCQMFVMNLRRRLRPRSLFIPNQLMGSSGHWKWRPWLSHVSALLPLLQYVLKLCKPNVAHFLLCSLSKLFHISLNTNRNTETDSIPAAVHIFHVSFLFYVVDHSPLPAMLPTVWSMPP